MQTDFLAILDPPPPEPAPPPPRPVVMSRPYVAAQRAASEIAAMRSRRAASVARFKRMLVADPGEDAPPSWKCPKCKLPRAGHSTCHSVGIGRFLLCSHKKRRATP